MRPMSKTWSVILWIILGAAILALDYAAGPNIAVAYLFLIPVALAAYYNGGFWGINLAIVLPLTRFCFHFAWDDQLSLWDRILNAAIRVIILAGAAYLLDRVKRQAREIKILQGILPVCMFCKKIRTPEQEWQQIETYITKHSEAFFSHTFCPECGKKFYADLLGGDRAVATKPPAAPLSSK
jgi:hypothetical protein